MTIGATRCGTRCTAFRCDERVSVEDVFSGKSIEPTCLPVCRKTRTQQRHGLESLQSYAPRLGLLPREGRRKDRVAKARGTSDPFRCREVVAQCNESASQATSAPPPGEGMARLANVPVEQRWIEDRRLRPSALRGRHSTLGRDRTTCELPASCDKGPSDTSVGAPLDGGSQRVERRRSRAP